MLLLLWLLFFLRLLYKRLSLSGTPPDEPPEPSAPVNSFCGRETKIARLLGVVPELMEELSEFGAKQQDDFQKTNSDKHLPWLF